MQNKAYVIFHTTLHSERVALIVGLIVDELQKNGIHPEMGKANILMLALHHDIGKYFVKPELIAKPGGLNPQEREEIKKHAIWSYEMLKCLNLTEEECNIVRWHHEKLDGSGYPDGIAGDLIPLETQVITVADIYDALTSERPYRTKEYSHEEAIGEMKKDKGINQELVYIIDKLKPKRYKDKHVMSNGLDRTDSIELLVSNMGYAQTAR